MVTKECIITHDAIKVGDDIYSLPKPNRHVHVFQMIYELGICRKYGNEKQGFVDESGVFYHDVKRTS